MWIKCENLLLSCLRTGDDRSAHLCLERLVDRFGDNNERIMGFKGLLKEAEAGDKEELEQVLKEYEGILSESDTNIVRCPLYESPRLEWYADDASRSLSPNDGSPSSESWVEPPRLSPP